MRILLVISLLMSFSAFAQRVRENVKQLTLSSGEVVEVARPAPPVKKPKK